MPSETITSTPWWEAYRSTVRTGERHRIEVFMRSLSPTPGGHARRGEVLDRLEELNERRILDGFEVFVVGRKVCLCDRCVEMATDTGLLSKLSALREWGDGIVRPTAFEEREVHSEITGEHHRVLLPPELCVSVHVDEQLSGVFPCSIDGETITVGEFLAALSTEPPEPFLRAADA